MEPEKEKDPFEEGQAGKEPSGPLFSAFKIPPKSPAGKPAASPQAQAGARPDQAPDPRQAGLEAKLAEKLEARLAAALDESNLKAAAAASAAAEKTRAQLSHELTQQLSRLFGGLEARHSEAAETRFAAAQEELDARVENAAGVSAEKTRAQLKHEFSEIIARHSAAMEAKLAEILDVRFTVALDELGARVESAAGVSAEKTRAHLKHEFTEIITRQASAMEEKLEGAAETRLTAALDGLDDKAGNAAAAAAEKARMQLKHEFSEIMARQSSALEAKAQKAAESSSAAALEELNARVEDAAAAASERAHARLKHEFSELLARQASALEGSVAQTTDARLASALNEFASKAEALAGAAAERVSEQLKRDFAELISGQSSVIEGKLLEEAGERIFSAVDKDKVLAWVLSVMAEKGGVAVDKAAAVYNISSVQSCLDTLDKSISSAADMLSSARTEAQNPPGPADADPKVAARRSQSSMEKVMDSLKDTLSYLKERRPELIKNIRKAFGGEQRR